MRKEIIHGKKSRQNFKLLDTANLDNFRAFWDETDFPAPERLGERGPVFKYPEWLIMFIAILSVKLSASLY
jgi:hypothetical protein